jgi:hypothetical protein
MYFIPSTQSDNTNRLVLQEDGIHQMPWTFHVVPDPCFCCYGGVEWAGSTLQISLMRSKFKEENLQFFVDLWAGADFKEGWRVLNRDGTQNQSGGLNFGCHYISTSEIHGLGTFGGTTAMVDKRNIFHGSG